MSNEVVISYETIFDMVRKEKNRTELQSLPPNFIPDVSDYLQAKKTILHKGFDENTPIEEKQKLMLHIQNMKKLLKELYDRRESKILQLAQNKVRTGNVLVDSDTMLAQEQQLFEQLTAQLIATRKEVLTQMTQSAADKQLFDATYGPTSSPGPSSTSTSTSTSETASSNTPPESASQSSHPTSESSSLPEQLDETPSMLCTLRFLQNVPKFVGRDLQVYGPYKAQQVASLPRELASILIEKNRAEEMEVRF